MRSWFAFLLLAAGLSANSPALAEKRVALVIGNGAYEHVGKLPNPANDANAMAALLRSAGFEVIGGSDLKRDEMADKVTEFSNAVRDGADSAVVFYAGHGIQIAEKNYLIPVDANLRTTTDVKVNTVDADDIVDAASAATVKLVLLDACRNNPFEEQMSKGDAKSRSAASNSGLAPMQSADGTLIEFATAPRMVAMDGLGQHSPFTQALLDNLATPGVEINDAMTKVRAEVQDETDKKQKPWQNSNLTGRYYVIAPPAPAPSPEVVVSLPPASGPSAGPIGGLSDDQAVETTFWESAQKSGRKEEYELYLQKYPKGRGRYSELAEVRIASLGHGDADKAPAPGSGPALDLEQLKNQPAEKADEDELAMDLAKWRDIQQKLTSLNFSTNGVDGNVGPGTRQAIRNWQTARGYRVSSFLNKPQLDALMTDTAMAPAPAVATRSVRYVGPSTRHATGGGQNNGIANGVGTFLGLGLGIMGCKAMHTC